MPRILHINRSDSQGGAAIAAYRHHDALRRAGFESKMLVVDKVTDDPDVLTIPQNFFSKYIPKVFNRLLTKRMNYYATWSYAGLGENPAEMECIKEADIIVLHWVNYYTLSIKAIEDILKTGKPVYWFMHDMWPITGGCHHSLECNRYKMHCDKCPMAHNRAGSHRKQDLSWRQFEEKLKKLTPYKNLKFLTPSQWLDDRVRESALFKNHSVDVVRNVLDTGIFKPSLKTEARKRLGLPQDKKLILFGADNISSPYKGWPMLREVLQEPIGDAEVVVYGRTPEGLQSEIALRLHEMGHISDTNRLIDLYSACDVFVTPSLADNYPNVLIEAMACGLPCVGTNIGGIPELIYDNETGKLAKSMEAKDLREAIIDILNSGPECYSPEKVRNPILLNNSYDGGMVRYFKDKDSAPIKGSQFLNSKHP